MIKICKNNILDKCLFLLILKIRKITEKSLGSALNTRYTKIDITNPVCNDRIVARKPAHSPRRGRVLGSWSEGCLLTIGIILEAMPHGEHGSDTWCVMTNEKELSPI